MAKSNWVYLMTSNGFKVKIDRSDIRRAGKHSWRVSEGTTGRQRVVTSIRGPKGVRQITLGRFLKRPPPDKQVYPRRFHNGLDYRKTNLIVCTLKERQRLLPKKSGRTSSSYRGVSLERSTRKWRAGIEVNGKSINLGNFQSETDAAHAYNRAARKYFGSMAYQNPVGRNGNRRRQIAD